MAGPPSGHGSGITALAPQHRQMDCRVSLGAGVLRAVGPNLIHRLISIPTGNWRTSHIKIIAFHVMHSSRGRCLLGSELGRRRADLHVLGPHGRSR